MFTLTDPTHTWRSTLSYIPQQTLALTLYGAIKVPISATTDGVDLLERIQGATKRPRMRKRTEILRSLEFLLARDIDLWKIGTNRDG
jgi:hypothetical protein